MKVALLPSWYPPNGGEFFVDQAQELAANGVEVSVLVPCVEPLRKPGRWLRQYLAGVTEERDGAVQVLRYSVPKLSASVHEMPRRTLAATEKLFAALCAKHGKPDLIHAHSAMWSGYAAASLARQYRLPYVLTEHRSRFNFPSLDVDDWMAPYFAMTFQEASAVLLVGSLLARGIKPYWSGVGQAEVLSNGVHGDKFRIGTPLADGRFHFAFVGALDRRKGIDLLLEALRTLRGDGDAPMLHVLGDGALRPWVQQQVAAHGLQRQVRLYGHLPNARIAELLGTMHAFVLPTRYDAQGVVFLEAMSCGLPVIATEGAPPEICPEFAGFRIPIDDAAALALVMRRTMRDYAQFDRQRIRQYVLDRFEFKHVIARLLDIYSDALARYPR